VNVPALISRKRDGGELDRDEWAAIVGGFVAGTVAPEQMSALLMAGVIRGFTTAEAEALTEILLASGEQLDLRGLRGPVVDKHSTGGVADTTTLVVAPILAAAGVQVAKLSGPGLGHTGGTIDKLAAIPGLRTHLTIEQMLRQVGEVGIAVCAASADLAPADKRLYALRDVTGTVPSPALIASSVMSKKLAAGAPNIVLDVKAGSGGVVGDRDEARGLAELCVRLGAAHGRRVRCLVTDMRQPLGVAVGNALEVRAAIEVLAGRGDRRLQQVAVALAQAGLDLVAEAAEPVRAEEVLASGAALEAFRKWIHGQGGPDADPEDLAKRLPAAPVRRAVTASAPGTVAGVDPRAIGELAVTLGAGRRHPSDVIDPAVGIILDVRIGDPVGAGDRLATIHAATETAADAAAGQLVGAIELTDGPPPQPPALVVDEVGPDPA
jgi:pyrimidine-nucleoside phosphorylase